MLTLSATVAIPLIRCKTTLFNNKFIATTTNVNTITEIETKRAEVIGDRMKNAPPNVIQSAKYLPSESPPDYQYMMGVVKRVASIAQNINSKPVRLFN